MTELTKPLSGSALKMIAVICMAIDHAAYFLLSHNEAFRQALFAIDGMEITAYYLLRCVGRLAFPLFAFLIVEGFRHTRNHHRYWRNLLIVALISEVPWVLLHDGALHLRGHNVMFTLLFGYSALLSIDRLGEQQWKQVAALAGWFVITLLLAPDYGVQGFAFIMMLSVTCRTPAIQAVIGSSMLRSTWIAGLAFIPINMYNGKRGFIRSSWAKYCFYAFYPLHLLLIWAIKHHVFSL